MVSAHLSLERISTGHSVFERDQVLTHDQLNSLADYADDQARLTRVRLLGVGIVCGLRARLDSGRVRLSRGVGVTSDGDLLHLEEEVEYDRFVEYDDSFPAYPPLMDASVDPATRRRAHQLVAVGVANDRARPLNELSPSEHGFETAGATAVLLMESYLQDDDLCSGTDCDNLGQEAVHNLKLLLVSNETGELLLEDVSTAADAFDGVAPLHADRPVFGSGVTTLQQIHNQYRAACTGTRSRLSTALQNLNSRCSGLCQEVLGGDPWSGGWQGRLNHYHTTYAPEGVPATLVIQYYHAFLTDLTEAYNDLVEAFLDDRTVCGPSFAAFPKHLVLGELSAGGGDPAVRTRFYPSPLTSRTAQGQGRAAFLLRRLDVLIQSFEVPTPSQAPQVRITPSAGAERPLQERAIPFYYSPAEGAAAKARRFWSESLARRGLADHAYGYFAPDLGGEAPARNPLAAHLARFTHFRVEGHLGRPATAALAEVEKEIRDHNLPFQVRAVLLHTNAANLVQQPPRRRAELYHLHQIIRRELRRRLQEAREYAQHLGGQIADAIAGNVVKNVKEEGAAQPVGQLASSYRSAVGTAAQQTLDSLGAGYAEYLAGGDWQARLATTLQQASLFKRGIGPVSQLVFDTPLDVLIGSTHSEWLPYLDQVIAHQEKVERERFLFSSFRDRHPQLEHAGGVPRGGTLVLVYNNAGTVVADFALPYVAHEPVAEGIDPVLSDPPARPAATLQQGIRVLAARQDAVEEEINKWELERFKPKWQIEIHEHIDRFIKPEIDRRFLDQRDHLEFYHGSLKDIIQGLVVHPETRVPVGPKGPTGVSELVDLEAKAQVEQMRTLTDLLKDPRITEKQRSIYETQLQSTQQAFAERVQPVAQHLAMAETDLRSGSAGRRALTTLMEGAQMLGGTDYGQMAVGSLMNVAQSAENDAFRNLVGGTFQQRKI